MAGKQPCSPSGSSADLRGKYVDGHIHKVFEVKVPSSGSRYFDSKYKTEIKDEG